MPVFVWQLQIEVLDQPVPHQTTQQPQFECHHLIHRVTRLYLQTTHRHCHHTAPTT